MSLSTQPESDMLTILFAIAALPLALWLGLCVVIVFLNTLFEGLAG